MSEMILEDINRKQLSVVLFRFSLFGFFIVLLSIVAFVIKIYIFTASSNKGYEVFILRNLFLSIILMASSHYAKKNETKFAFAFDKANGPGKLFWITIFVISMVAIHELLHLILLKLL